MDALTAAAGSRASGVPRDRGVQRLPIRLSRRRDCAIGGDRNLP
ncbi:hypothetical protein Thpro_021659 [Acidihalobacter prosperus]|uniref:Uncharacterized protein n=1 Tax=Acidihalobacter prosperus TaxID=160660 RepID=A0A1A6C441_9GAMM|nr:hypothetical protein Thpro_021659 [Acidihalobacter prosperus]